MAFLKILLITAVMTVAGTFGVLRYVQLEREGEIARLTKENAEMRMTLNRRMIAAAIASGGGGKQPAGNARSAPTVFSSDASRAAPAGETRHWPVRSYFNAGRATPVATLQTMAWACDQGDTATMAGLFIIDDEAKPRAEAIYAAIPNQLRIEWDSMEAFAAAMIVHNGIEKPYPGAQVLALARIEPIRERRVALQLPGASVSGLVFQQTAEGWKYVISDAVVGDYIARMAAEAAQR